MIDIYSVNEIVKLTSTDMNVGKWVLYGDVKHLIHQNAEAIKVVEEALAQIRCGNTEQADNILSAFLNLNNSPALYAINSKSSNEN